VIPRPRTFNKYWEVCGLPRADRLNQVITWNTAVDETCVALARRLDGVTVEQLRALVEDLKGTP
jgi:hypothetical protein